MSDIKVYKTTVEDRQHAREILEKIRNELPESDPSFDLDDCDKVLRVESQKSIREMLIEEIVKNHGYTMEELL